MRREPVRLVTPDGALVRGILWTPPAGTPWKTAVVLTHPRGDFCVHYACPLLAAAGYAVFGFAHALPEQRHRLPARGAASSTSRPLDDEMRRRGAEAVVLLGNSGGGSLMALAQEETACGDGWVGIAAHPGEGVFMMQAIDPSVADESDPFSRVPELDMYDPDNGWRPWPEPCRYDPRWLATLSRGAARARRAHRRDRARRRSPTPRAPRSSSRASTRRATGRLARLAQARGAPEYLVIYRTLADPAYLDLDDRPRRAADGLAVRVPRSVRRELRRAAGSRAR